MKHTPGPWQIGQQHHTGGGEFYNASCVYQAGTETPAVCSVYGLPINQTRDAVVEMATRRKDTAEGLANARLIAAAPELLAALQAIVALDDGDSPDLWHYEKEFAAGVAAIAKATA